VILENFSFGKLHFLRYSLYEIQGLDDRKHPHENEPFELEKLNPNDREQP
jgi:hypothetical protein